MPKQDTVNAEQIANVRIINTAARSRNHCCKGTQQFVPFVLFSYMWLSEHTGLMFRTAQERCYGQYVASTTKSTQALKQNAGYFSQIWIFKSATSNFREIRPVGTALIYAEWTDTLMDGRTYMLKPTGVFSRLCENSAYTRSQTSWKTSKSED